MARRRRGLTPFGMSFLDVMCCGFGAVVLLVMILNGQILERREAKGADLREALDRAETLERFAKADLDEIRKRSQDVQLEEGELQRKVEELRDAIVREQADKEKAAALAAQRAKELAEIERENRELAEKARKEAEKKLEGAPEPGEKVVGFTGDGQRQYLTGLKLGGRHTLILLDASASMLDEKIVNIVRRKLMPPAARRQAPKWQRAVRTFHWLVANLQPDRKFQAYRFNTEAVSLVAGSDGAWLDSGDAEKLGAAIEGARVVVPDRGTSLINAFAVASKLTPRPDSVILITDGLPTQNERANRTGAVSREDREELFEDAAKALPSGIPVNTLLLPIEGDPTAAEAYWRLAIESDGSFITPTRDWP